MPVVRPVLRDDGRRVGRRVGLASRREVDGEAGPLAGHALDLHLAARLLHDAVDRGQAEPRSLARPLGREERLEDPRPRGLVHTGAVVVHTEPGAAFPRRAHLRPAWRGVDLHGDASAPGHRVARVDHEVEHHLLHLRQVRHDRRHAGVAPHLELVLGAQQPAEHLLHPRHDPAQVEHHHVHRLAAAEGEELADEGGAAPGGTADLLDVGTVLVGERRVLEQELRVAVDRREEVVEVVRHAAGEPADGLHLPPLAARLLGLAKRLLGGVPLGDVHAEAHPVAHAPAVGLQHRAAVRLVAPVVAGRGAHTVLRGVRPQLAERGPPARAHPLPVVGMHGVQPPVALDLLPALPRHGAPARLVLHKAPHRVGGPDDLRGAVDDGAIALLGAAERGERVTRLRLPRAQSVGHAGEPLRDATELAVARDVGEVLVQVAGGHALRGREQRPHPAQHQQLAHHGGHEEHEEGDHREPDQAVAERGIRLRVALRVREAGHHVGAAILRRAREAGEAVDALLAVHAHPLHRLRPTRAQHLHELRRHLDRRGGARIARHPGQQLARGRDEEDDGAGRHDRLAPEALEPPDLARHREHPGDTTGGIGDRMAGDDEGTSVVGVPQVAAQREAAVGRHHADEAPGRLGHRRRRGVVGRAVAAEPPVGLEEPQPVAPRPAGDVFLEEAVAPGGAGVAHLVRGGQPRETALDALDEELLPRHHRLGHLRRLVVHEIVHATPVVERVVQRDRERRQHADEGEHHELLAQPDSDSRR